MRQANAPLASLHLEDAAVEIGTPIGTAHQVTVQVAFVAAERSTRSGAHLVLHRLNLKTAIATVEVTLVGVDDTITAAHWLVLFRAETRARTALPGRPDTSG